ncbi:multi-sensor hybrid histidine kinase [Pseudopedobacter saltans DSM 12145]|uniref:histidine kinase n=1 Tax=Pseudopedobacter saltans (strain ATCC 51119 / DSM 12145 / JCM 21818 / CCUG 39354 / LMG 10337 / NBRC 100064 / NCIMB 13643) TaxID=762903 RepID=F0S5G9_PSESL|nr:response regulator [Pseudopedobacter saltans]ADY53133.1 multi-sensor hybrid histidine kinase [Pseudopedobacter saltans DSM 12145]
MAKTFLRNLQIGFGISLLILILSSGASYISIQKLIQSRAELSNTRQIIEGVTQILINLQDAETGQRGYLITGRDAFLEPYYAGVKNLHISIDKAIGLTEGNTITRKKIQTLSSLANERLAILEETIVKKRKGEAIPFGNLERGRSYMDKCRYAIEDIISHEEQLLARNSAQLENYISYSIIFIVIAAFASVFITIYFYNRVRIDFRKRDQLQTALKEKDAEMTRRINIIRSIANRVSEGDYEIQVKDNEEDDLGSVANSLNHMTKSLKTAFEKINANEWQQTGLALLNKNLVGNKSVEDLCNQVLKFVVNYTDSYNGALYLSDNDKIILKAAYGLEGHMPKSLKVGEGMVGQVFKDKAFRHFKDLTGDDFTVSFSSGKVKIHNIALMPLILDNECLGVIELGLPNEPREEQISFFQESCKDIGLAISDAYNRNKIQTLLEESQAQAEELQMQHSELENLNMELEAQTQKLQASEEELKVQQEELLQTNQELEERSKLLEEKNHLIAERNLEIQKKAEELALSTKYKSEFLANMSHELRTPLNSILLLSRLMAENTEHNLNEEQIESANVIQSSGASLLELIDEILDLSKIEAGKMKLEFQKIEISGIVSALKALFLPIIKEKNLDFDIKIGADVGQIIETDKMRVEQVMKNLMSNAIKFTSRGSIGLQISRENNNILFAVKDTGIGIPAEQQKIIFEAFQQADGSTRRKFGGTGLGLSISREIAKLLGGEIRLLSKESEGSIFTLVVPISRDESNVHISKPHVEELIEEIATEVTEIQQLTASSNTENLAIHDIPDEVEDDRNNIKKGDKVILIVEDDINFAKALLKYTRKKDYKGVVVVRGDIAAGFAEKYQPLAILLDIQLPIKDGWQVMDEIKSNNATKHIPVHIMSSLKVKKESLLKGAIDFIDKPVALEQINDMFKRIEEALNKYPKKVLIVEENQKHASALSYFLSTFNIQTEIKTSVEDSIDALSSGKADCVILDMGVPDMIAYETLEAVKRNSGLENLPIIVFTGKNLSQFEEAKLRQYADSIVLKTAHSYQRILDEVGLFLHLVEEKQSDTSSKRTNKLGALQEVLKDKKVLVADDDVRNIFSLTKALEKYQMKVVSAIDGKEALVQLENNPDTAIVLMDMMMPEMDGYETIREIRKNKKSEELPVIAVTAKAMVGDREKCIMAGASDYISKPVDTDQLLSLLRVWLYD